jgi:hypothetical protein
VVDFSTGLTCASVLAAISRPRIRMGSRVVLLKSPPGNCLDGYSLISADYRVLLMVFSVRQGAGGDCAQLWLAAVP